MDNQYEDTDKVRVVVYPTLIIPAYQVKPKRKKREWATRITLVAIICTWLILAATTAFLFWMIMLSGRSMY